MIKSSLNIQIWIRNVTNTCEENLTVNLAQYFTQFAHATGTVTANPLTIYSGHFCYSRYEPDIIREYIIQISGVKIGFPYFCYQKDKNNPELVERSYVNYIIVSIIFLVYAFYQLPIESAFYVEDRKIAHGFYYRSDSPFGGSVILKKNIFSGNNKYIAAVRILAMIGSIIGLVYYAKSKTYEYCYCSFELWPNLNVFINAETYYGNKEYFGLYTFFGVIHIIFVHYCIFANSNGSLDDFIIVNGFCLETLSVKDFRQRDHITSASFKVRKILAFFSLQFWSQVFFIDCENHSRCFYSMPWIIIYSIQFPFNFVLVLCSTFCPVMSTVCVCFIKAAEKIIMRCTCMTFESIAKRIIVRWLAFVCAIGYLYATYSFSFNVFFNGISYLIQFLIFTLCLAVPRFSLQQYIYLLFVASCLLYIFRFIFQFSELYKKLLETILDIQDETKIQIKVFNEIVIRYFPFSYELFYLYAKIIFCSLFFTIIFDTIQKLDFTNIKERLDLGMVISVIFLFGPPRLAEVLFATDFTSRVHMKETEIKRYIKSRNIDQNPNPPNEDTTNNQPITETRVMFDELDCIRKCQSCGRSLCSCCTCCNGCSCFKVIQYIVTCLCGCFRIPLDEEEDNDQKCECCVFLHLKSIENTSNNATINEITQTFRTKTEITIVRIPSLWLPEGRNENAQVGIDESTPLIQNENTEETYERVQRGANEGASAATNEELPEISENAPPGTIGHVQAKPNENAPVETSESVEIKVSAPVIPNEYTPEETDDTDLHVRNETENECSSGEVPDTEL